MSLHTTKLIFIVLSAINIISTESLAADRPERTFTQKIAILGATIGILTTSTLAVSVDAQPTETVKLKNMPRVIIFAADNQIIEIPGNKIVSLAAKTGRIYEDFSSTSFQDISVSSLIKESSDLKRNLIVLNSALRATNQKEVTLEEIEKMLPRYRK